MENAKHTPGPLHIEQCAGMISINSSAGKVLAVIEPWMAARPQEREANAILYAAAPDMLSALEALWSGVPDRLRVDISDETPNFRNSSIATFPVLPEVLLLLKNAIAKAGGR